MKPCECDKELLVIEAARSSAWDPELRNHVASCRTCTDVALAVQALNAARAFDAAEARIPDAGFMWWKAQLLSKRVAAERATRPIRYVQHFACACGVFVVVALCALQRATLRGWFESLQPGAARTFAAVGSRFDFYAVQHAVTNWVEGAVSLQRASLAMILSAGALSILVAFAAYLTRSEE
jgi:hypothetical protein